MSITANNLQGMSIMSLQSIQKLLMKLAFLFTLAFLFANLDKTYLQAFLR